MEVRWERMFPDQLESAFAACPLVYFSYGMCEPHGPQNAVGLDSLKAHAIACRAARTGGGIVAPPDYWHIHEIGNYAVWGMRAIGDVERKWMTAVPPWIHFKNICYHVRAAEVIGFRAAIFLTGHYGPNWRDLKTLIDLLQPHTGAQLYALPDFEANHPGFDGDGKASGDHAGKVETSLLWALEPGCVDVSRFPDPAAPGPHFAMGHNARLSNRKTGERMVEDEVNWLCTKGRELLQAWQEPPPGKRLLTYEQVESFWREIVEPVLGDFETLKPADFSSLPPDSPAPEESSWYSNSRIPEGFR